MTDFSLQFPQNDFRPPERKQPSFFKYPQQNNRTSWLPVWTPTILVVPWVRDGFGNRIPGSDVWDVSFSIERSSVARVAGHDHVGLYNPDFNIYRVKISNSELPSYKIDLENTATFYRFNESSGILERIEGGISEAKDGDYVEYTLDRGVFGRIRYYTGTDYYDFSSVEIPTEEIPRGHYDFVWEAHYNKRIFGVEDIFQCICIETETCGTGVTRLPYPMNHPGEIIGDMYDKTPAVYFNNTSKAEDTTIGLYRPLADALQDIFDEQTLLHGNNWVHEIPIQYIPYLAYLIGVDLPNFTNATDEFNEKIRRVMVERGANLQKLKGSRRAIVEMFDIFGLVASIVQCWTTSDGSRFVAPGERLKEEYRNDPEVGNQEITADEVCQTDPLVLNYNESGFGEIDVPLMYRATEPTVVLDAFVVEDLPSWSSNHKYNAGDTVIPLVGNGFAYQCVVTGTSNANEPEWVPQLDEEVIDGTIVWKCVGHMRGALEGVHHDLLSNDPNLFTDPTCVTDISGYPIQCDLFKKLTNNNSCNRAVDNYWQGFLGYSRVVIDDISTLYEEHHKDSPYKPDIEVKMWQKNFGYKMGDFVKSSNINGTIFRCIISGTSGSTEPDWNTSINNTTVDNSVKWMTVSTDSQGVQRDSQGSIIFDRVESRVRAVFSKYFEFENSKLYVFATYKRQRINFPEIYQLSDLRSNRFDVHVFEKSGDDADISVYEYLLNLIARTKSFHSILRKIVISKAQDSVYNVTDFCTRGNLPGVGDRHLECIQEPPPALPECSGSGDYVCSDSGAAESSKEADAVLKSRIASGLKEEYDNWRRIENDYIIPENDFNNLQQHSAVEIPRQDYENAWNFRGQDRLTSAFLIRNVTPGVDKVLHIPDSTEMILIVTKSELNDVEFKSVESTDIPQQDFVNFKYSNVVLPPLDVGSYVIVEFKYEYSDDNYYVIGDIDPDHQAFSMDPRSKVTGLNLPVPTYCYGARVKESPAISDIVVPGEVVRCRPCVMLGQGFYYTRDCDLDCPPSLMGDRYAAFRADVPFILDSKSYNEQPELHFDNDLSLSRLCPGTTTRPNLDIERTNLFFPGHRFIRMGSLEYDFIHPKWNARPWDNPDIDICECPILNPLNQRLVAGEPDCCGEISEWIEFDDIPLKYRGNGEKPDILNLSGTSSEIMFTHTMYSTTGGSAYDITDDVRYLVDEENIEYTTHEYIDVDEPIFNSARRCGEESQRDFIDGYPAQYGQYKAGAEEFWTSRTIEKLNDDPFYCGDNPTSASTWPELLIVPDIEPGTYEFAATVSSGVPTDLPEYSGYRVDCGCTAVECGTGENDAPPGFCNIPLFYDDRGQLDTNCELLTVTPRIAISDTYDTANIIDECSGSDETLSEGADRCLEFEIIGEPGPPPPPPPPPFVCNTGVIGFSAAYPTRPGDIVR